MSLWKAAKDNAVARRLDDERLYATALREVESGIRRDGLWAQAIAAAKGDQTAAKSEYLRLRVQSLRDEEYATKRVPELTVEEERKAIASAERRQTQDHVDAIKHEWEDLSRTQEAKSGRFILPLVSGFVCALAVYLIFGLPRGVNGFVLLFGAAAIGFIVGMVIYRYLPGQRRLREVEQSMKQIQWWR